MVFLILYQQEHFCVVHLILGEETVPCRTVLYHYASEEAIRTIKTERNIRKKYAKGLKGDGVYFTSMSPHGQAKSSIAGGEQFVSGGKADYVIKVTIRRDVLMRKENSNGREVFCFSLGDYHLCYRHMNDVEYLSFEEAASMI